MKKKLISILVAFMILATVSVASAETLGLTQKHSGAWDAYGLTATLTYNPTGATFDYIVDGNIPLNTEYALIYYADIVPTGSTVPGIVGKVIALATPIDGVIHMEGSEVMNSIPYSEDANSVSTANGGNPGAKIWLVPSNNIIGDSPKTLNWANFPSGYLFEENLPNAINGVPSYLITYTYLAGTSLTGNAEVLACEIGTIGLSIDTPGGSLSFGQLYPGETSEPQDASITVTATDFATGENSCEHAPETVPIFVTVNDWTSLNGNTMPASSTIIYGVDISELFVPGTTYELPLGTTGAHLELTTPSNAVPDIYTQVITVTQVS